MNVLVLEENTHIILENPSIFCEQILILFSNDLYLYFLISSVNRSLELLTIQYYVAYPDKTGR